MRADPGEEWKDAWEKKRFHDMIPVDDTEGEDDNHGSEDGHDDGSEDDQEDCHGSEDGADD